MFSVRLSSSLLLIAFGISPAGPIGIFLGLLLRGVLGLFVEKGIFLIDISLDSLREGQKLKEFEKAAKADYEKATAKIYDESEKEKIRQQYLESIRRITFVGRPK